MAKQLVITTREQVQDNIKVHGIKWTAAWAKKRGVHFSAFYWMAFGKAPRLLSFPPLRSVYDMYISLYLRQVERGFSA